MSYKQKYKSIFGATSLITAPHYLTEKIIKKRIDKKGVRIPDKIWDKKFAKDLRYKYWHGAYFGEYIKACTILKKYDEDCVIKAIDSHECEKILSLHNKTLERISREYQEAKLIKEQTKEKVESFVSYKQELPPKQIGKKSKLGKLR